LATGWFWIDDRGEHWAIAEGSCRAPDCPARAGKQGERIVAANVDQWW
jgi:hypothetical protein